MSRLKVYTMKKLQKLSLKKGREKTPVEDEFELIPGEAAGEDVFTESLHNLLPEDISLKKKASAKKKKNSGVLARRIVLVMSCAVFVVCAVYLTWNLLDKKRGNDFYNKVASEWENIFDDTGAGDGAVARLTSLKSADNILCLKDRLNAGSSSDNVTYDTRIDEMRAKLSSLAENFPDLYGWISISNTTINYPLVQGADNDYYLNHAPDKSPLVNGSIFVDYRNNTEIMRNFNTVMYGHNLQGGGMFHDVQACFYENEEMFMNSYIYIYTMDGAYVFEPFAVYDTRADYQYFRTEFATTEEFVNFATEMQSNSIYKKDMEFVPTDRIITLSTCTNRSVDGRYALQAKLVQVIH